jgi:hypothetical protein
VIVTPIVPPPPPARSPAQQPAMSDEERESVRRTGADDGWRSRVEHGFPERIEDPVAVARLAAILRDTPTPQSGLSDEEREAIRQTGAEDARRSRVEHGFSERIEDPAAVARLAAILCDIPAPRPPSEGGDERNPAA